MRRTALALPLLLALALAGCGTDAPSDGDRPSGSSPSSPAEGGADGGADGGTGGVVGGTREEPTVAEPVDAPLAWQPVDPPAEGRVVVGPQWQARTDAGRTRVDLDGGGSSVSVAAGSGRTISEVLMSEDFAVVVRQDTAETDPSLVVAIDLATGEQRDVVSPAAASGGSWALTGGDLYFPTYGGGGAYCLATVALADANGEDGWCAPRRTGFSGLTASDLGVGVMTFDDARPVACRTANLLDGSGVPQPVEGPTPCLAWDVAAARDGFVWSEVPKPRRQEEAHFYASAYGAYVDLGPGTTGSLTPCGDSVFFVRDPRGADEPARLMRWTPGHTLEVAYTSTSVGNAFLGEPACGGGVITLSSFGEQGDETVSATVG